MRHKIITKKKTKENVIISEDEKPNRITDEIVHKINRNIIDYQYRPFHSYSFMKEYSDLIKFEDKFW